MTKLLHFHAGLQRGVARLVRRANTLWRRLWDHDDTGRRWWKRPVWAGSIAILSVAASIITIMNFRLAQNEISPQEQHSIGPAQAAPVEAAPNSGRLPANCYRLVEYYEEHEQPWSDVVDSLSFALHNGVYGSIAVANVTCGDTSYHTSTHASVDDVLMVQVFYENLGEETLPDPLLVGFDTIDDGESTMYIVARVRSGDDEAEARVPVITTLPRAYLEPVGGSSVWRRNTAPSGETPTYENALVSPDPIAPEMASLGVIPAGYDDAGTVTLRFRVRAVALSVNVEFLDPVTRTWAPEISVFEGDTVRVRLRATNEGNVELSAVEYQIRLPSDVAPDSLSPAFYEADGQERGIGASAAFSDFVNSGPLSVGDHRTLELELPIAVGEAVPRVERVLGYVKSEEVSGLNNVGVLLVQSLPDG